MLFKLASDIAVSLNWINLFEDFSPEYIGFHELNLEDHGMFFFQMLISTQKV